MIGVALLVFAASAGGNHYEAGISRFRANDCPAALAEFAESERAAENGPELALYRGICLAKTGQWDAAAPILRSWASSHSADARVWYWLAQTELYRKRFPEAKDAITRAIAYDPTSANAFRTLGEIGLQLKSYDDAYRAWIKANKLNPGDARTTYYIGRLFFEAEFWDQSASWLRRTLSLDPRHFAAMTYLALCAERLDMPDTATQLYLNAIRESKAQNSPFPWAFLSYGKLLRQTGRDREAQAVFEEGARLCPEAHLLTALGQMLASADQHQRAEEMLRRATEMDPSIPDAHYRLAMLLRASGHAAEAQSEMQKFQDAKEAAERNKVLIQAVRKEP